MHQTVVQSTSLKKKKKLLDLGDQINVSPDLVVDLSNPRSQKYQLNKRSIRIELILGTNRLNRYIQSSPHINRIQILLAAHETFCKTDPIIANKPYLTKCKIFEIFHGYYPILV